MNAEEVLRTCMMAAGYLPDESFLGVGPTITVSVVREDGTFDRFRARVDTVDAAEAIRRAVNREFPEVTCYHNHMFDEDHDLTSKFDRLHQLLGEVFEVTQREDESDSWKIGYIMEMTRPYHN